MESEGDALELNPPIIKSSWCVICGFVSKVLYDSSGVRVRVKSEAGLNLAGDPVEDYYNSEIRLFDCFFKVMKAKRPSGKHLWNFETESVPFCTSCAEQLTTIHTLLEELDKLRNVISNTVQVLREKMISEEEKFNQENVYQEDERYYWIRANVIGKDKVTLPGGSSIPLRRSSRPRSYRTSLSRNSNKPVVLITSSDKSVADDHLSTHLLPLKTDQEPADDLLQLHGSSRTLPSPQSKLKKQLNQTKPTKGNRKRGRKPKSGLTKKVQKPRRKRKEIFKEEILEFSDFEEPLTPPAARRKNDDEDDYLPPNEGGGSSASEDMDSEQEDLAVAAHLTKSGRALKSCRINKETGTLTYLHITFEVIGDSMFKCNTCETTVNNRDQVRNHVNRCHTKRYKCTQCSFRSGRKEHLRTHLVEIHAIKEDSTPSRIPCEICGKPLRPYKRREHLVSHYSPEEYQEADERGELEFIKKKAQCSHCGKCYRKTSELVRHEESKHSTSNDRNEKSKEAAKDKGKTEKLICTECGKIMFTDTGFRRHMRTHHSDPLEFGVLPFACTYCDKRFVRYPDLQKHLPIHTGNRPFKCSVCPRQFSEERRLKLHMNQHNNLRPHKCPECPSSFFQIPHLKAHFKTFHAPGSNPKRKSYTRGPDKGRFRIPPGATTVRRFQGNVDGERVELFEKLPRQCPHCPMSYLYPSQVKRHIDTHHNPNRVLGKGTKTPVDLSSMSQPLTQSDNNTLESAASNLNPPNGYDRLQPISDLSN